MIKTEETEKRKKWLILPFMPATPRRNFQGAKSRDIALGTPHEGKQR